MTEGELQDRETVPINYHPRVLQAIGGGKRDIMTIIQKFLDKGGEREGDGFGDTREIDENGTWHC